MEEKIGKCGNWRRFKFSHWLWLLLEIGGGWAEFQTSLLHVRNTQTCSPIFLLLSLECIHRLWWLDLLKCREKWGEKFYYLSWRQIVGLPFVGSMHVRFLVTWRNRVNSRNLNVSHMCNIWKFQIYATLASAIGGGEKITVSNSHTCFNLLIFKSEFALLPLFFRFWIEKGRDEVSLHLEAICGHGFC